MNLKIQNGLHRENASGLIDCREEPPEKQTNRTPEIDASAMAMLVKQAPNSVPVSVLLCRQSSQECTCQGTR